MEQSAVFEFCICIDGHASAAVKRAHCVVKTKQFFLQSREMAEEFDIEVADAAEDLVVRVVGDVDCVAGLPLAL